MSFMGIRHSGFGAVRILRPDRVATQPTKRDNRAGRGQDRENHDPLGDNPLRDNHLRNNHLGDNHRGDSHCGDSHRSDSGLGRPDRNLVPGTAVTGLDGRP